MVILKYISQADLNDYSGIMSVGFKKLGLCCTMPFVMFGTGKWARFEIINASFVLKS
jgi:hypothetical protein